VKGGEEKNRPKQHQLLRGTTTNESLQNQTIKKQLPNMKRKECYREVIA